MKRKIMIICVTLIVLICAATAIIFVNRAGRISVDWQLHSTWIQEDLETVPGPDFTLKGSIIDRSTECDKLLLNFLFPNDFHLSLPSPETGDILSHVQNVLNLNYYGSWGYGYDSIHDRSVFTHFVISTEKEYVLIYWQDGSDRFLVASKNPNVPPTEILDYFRDYIDFHHLADND